MEELLFVLEYKVKGELFVRKYAYDSKCLDSTEGLLYFNNVEGSQIVINPNYLEYRIERPIRINESFDDTIETK